MEELTVDKGYFWRMKDNEVLNLFPSITRNKRQKEKPNTKNKYIWFLGEKSQSATG